MTDQQSTLDTILDLMPLFIAHYPDQQDPNTRSLNSYSTWLTMLCILADKPSDEPQYGTHIDTALRQLNAKKALTTDTVALILRSDVTPTWLMRLNRLLSLSDTDSRRIIDCEFYLNARLPPLKKV